MCEEGRGVMPGGFELHDTGRDAPLKHRAPSLRVNLVRGGSHDPLRPCAGKCSQDGRWCHPVVSSSSEFGAGGLDAIDEVCAAG